MKAPGRIALGICGGVAAYKTALIIRMLQRHGMKIAPVVTPHALSFIGRETLSSLCDRQVYCDAGLQREGFYLYHTGHDHIRLAEWAEALLVSPATANTIAKITHGIADNLLTTLALSFFGEKPLILAPAMNSRMWENPATQQNIATLRERGVHVLDVAHGQLACGSSGSGRMLSPQEIADYMCSIHHASDSLRGKKVLISAGGTREPVDSVRVLTNRSSGTMGAALARAAYMRGAQVSVIVGEHRSLFPETVECVHAPTVDAMQQQLESRFPECDICIMAAAVSDYRVATPEKTKIDSAKQRSLTLRLEPTRDILAELGTAKKGQFLVGFSLSDTPQPDKTVRKLREKKCDMMVANTAAESLDTESIRFSLSYGDGCEEPYQSMSKLQAAHHILERIRERIGASGSSTDE